MAEWTPFFVLPNVNVGRAIEGNRLALVPPDDHRVAILAKTYPAFRTFFGRFTDAFGVAIEPSVLIGQGPIRSIDAVARFRDLVSVSTIARCRALQLIHQSASGTIWSNTFDIYPWMVGRDHEHLLGSTPAHIGFHEVKAFHGQSSPDVPYTNLNAWELDIPLTAELILRWRRRYLGRKKDWSDISLFRSLNMAHHASQLPAGTDTTRLDIGRMVALWVSAFEILAHPAIGKSGTKSVFELLTPSNGRRKRAAPSAIMLKSAMA